MKKVLVFILLSLLLIGCKPPTEPITENSIKVFREGKPFFMAGISRRLVTVNHAGEIIDKVNLCDDIDSIAKSYLFDSKSNYILIDCDGRWYYIDKNTGLIKKDRNYNAWIKKELPPNYIGTFMINRAKGNRDYYLIKEDSININDVYEFGGGDE